MDEKTEEDVVKEVMAYFGEELGSGGQARDIMRYVTKTRGLGAGTYFAYMNSIREVLMERGFEVPFRAVYRRRAK